MKTKKLETLERYTTVAVRAKISVEVEQRKRLGAWGKRVLVLDGATLYAYKTKGDGGSVGGWAIGGADVHVRRGNDSNRDDGRHILVIARPPVYKLVFAFSTVYEQARMIQALSSSGATVTGLDAIMLLKNLRQQQEQEQKEQEERQREQDAQTSQIENEEEDAAVTSEYENDEEDMAVTSIEEGQDQLTNEDEKLETMENGNLYEVTEIEESIYDQGTGIVSNPTYSSTVDLSTGKDGDRIDGVESSTSGVSISTSRVSETALSTNQDSDEKVNPLPKPPRASVSEGSLTNNSSVPDSEYRAKNVNKSDEASDKQSVLNSGDVQEDLSGDAGLRSQRQSGSAGDQENSDRFGEEAELDSDSLSEAKNDLYTASDEDTEEGEGHYEFNPDPHNGQYPGDAAVSGKATGEDTAKDGGSFENNYVELVSKMKLERGLSIESQSGGPLLDGGSPEGIRRILGDSPLSDVSIKTPSPVNETGSSKGYSIEKREQESQNSAVSDDALSDNDEKFEQLYRELSSNSTTYEVQSSEREDTSKAIVTKNYDNLVQTKSEGSLNVTKKDTEIPNGEGKEKETVDGEDRSNEKQVSEDDQSPEGTPLKRVSSIIKKKGSPSSGKSKKVQFNLEGTTVVPGTTPSPLLSPKADQDELSGTDKEKTKDSASSRTLSLKKSKKEPMSPPPGSPMKKKSDGPASPGQTPSPTKKRGIFSNIFTSASSKKTVDGAPPKEDTPSKKEPPPTKVDTGTKKTPAVSQTSLRRQPTVDLTAPLIIGGSVEMGGSVSGKVSSRRIEVRDGHVLAYMAKATSPMSRLSLVGLSVAPMVGGVHSNALTLTRASRCMMVIKLTSRDEMMRWINILSDEVIRLTPENQRTSLVLYPSPKKEPENKAEEENDKRPVASHDLKEISNKTMNEKPQEVEKETDKKLGPSNGHTEEKGGMPSAKKTEGGKAPHSLSNGEVVVNGDKAEVTEDEDTGDGWLRKKKLPVVEEFEMDELPDSGEKSSDNKKPTTVKLNNTKSPTKRESDGLKVFEEHFKEEKESEKTVRKVNKLNIQEIWKEHKDIMSIPQKRDSPVQRRSLDNKQHPPLRRLSAQETATSRPKSKGQDTDASLIFVNNSPKHDYHANCHPPLERLSNRSRILSASESNLRRDVDQKPASNIHHLHRFGSELTLREKPKKEFNNNMVSDGKDNSNVLVSNRIMRNQASARKNISQQGRMNGTSPTSSPSHYQYKRSVSFEPRQVEIVESKISSSQSLNMIGIDEALEEEDQWFDEDEPCKEEPQPANDNLPGITWSVAATREKFELLCSVRGENKGGNLTTKTPISRKKSVRSSVKKRRSIEGGSGKRANNRRNVRRSLQGTNGNNVSSPSKPDSADTLAVLQAYSEQQYITDNDSVATPNKPDELEALPVQGQSTFRLQPVRDRRKNFERDVTDSLDSSVHTSSSMDSVSDIIPINHNDSHILATKEPTSPQKSPLKRTQNILQATTSPSSSPEPAFISSKLINGRPKGNIPERDRGIVSRSLTTETQMNDERDSEVVTCWRGPYIAQESDLGVNTDPNAEIPKRDRKELKEAEQAVLSNISNAFLAKRRLLTREVAVARIQEKLSSLEETIWDIQASMAEIDKMPSSTNAKAANNWKVLERSLRTAEDEMTYWTSRLTQTQREADQAREKLASALVSGLAQYNPGGEQVNQKHRQQLLKKYTSRDLGEEDEDDHEEDYEMASEAENLDSFA